MRIILAVLATAFLLTGCSSYQSMEELMAEATQCVLEYNEDGVIKPAPEEYKQECWIKVNKRADIDEKRRKERESTLACLWFDMVEYCNGWGDCRCITHGELNSVLNR